MGIKVGIIGFGYMGHFHWNKIRMLDGAELIAVFDISEEKLTEAKNEGIIAYRTLETFLANTEIDLVVICTPNNFHKDYAVASMEAGKDVLCEKPATMNVKEMEIIAEISNKTGKIFTVHQNRRWDVDYKVVRNIIENGTIGNITTIESKVMGQRGVCYGWRALPEAGGGMLFDWGVHLIDQMLQLYKNEKVCSVYARIFSVLTPAVDDFFEVDMHFTNGVCARVSVGTFALQKVPRWFIYGDRGTLELDDFTGEHGGIARIKGQVKGFDSVVGKKGLGPSRTMAPLAPENLEVLELPQEIEEPLTFWKNIVAVVERKEKPYVSMNEILRQMKLVELAFESSERNEVMKCLV